MMNADEVIESYVHDVAKRLPRSKRNDVAFELRALLDDELAAKSRAAGREPDKAMAIELLTGFGSPADAASRYHQQPAVIAPADTHHFLIWSGAGALAIAVLAALSEGKDADGGEALLQWLGALVIVFALMGWWRRWRPQHGLRWKPKRVQDPTRRAHRGASITLGLLTLIPLWVYAAPRSFVSTAFLGRIPTHGLALDPDFPGSALWIATLAALGLQTSTYIWAAVDGRWRRATRWTSILALVAIGLLLAAHTDPAEQQQVFLSAQANATAAPIFGLVGAFTILCAFYDMYCQWARTTPAPALKNEAVRSSRA